MRWTTALCCWIGLAGLYLAFAGQTDVAEIIAGASAGLIATGFSWALRRQQDWRFRLRGEAAAAAPRLAFRLAGKLVQESALVAWRLVALAGSAGPGGSIASQPFAPAAEDDSGRTRRALAILCACLTPNSYVIDCRRDALVQHRLVRTPPSADREWAI